MAGQIIPLDQVEDDIGYQPKAGVIPLTQVEEDIKPYSGPTLGTHPIAALTSADWWLILPWFILSKACFWAVPIRLLFKE